MRNFWEVHCFGVTNLHLFLKVRNLSSIYNSDNQFFFLWYKMNMVSRAVFANFEHSVFSYPNVTIPESRDPPPGILHAPKVAI